MNILRKLYAVLHSGGASLRSYQEHTHERSFFCTSSPNLLFFVLLSLAILMGVKWYLIVASIYLSLMISDQHLFIFPLSIWMSSMERRLFMCSTHFLMGLFILGVLRFIRSLYITLIRHVICIHFQAHCLAFRGQPINIFKVNSKRIAF